MGFFARWYLITKTVHLKDKTQEKLVFKDIGLKRNVVEKAIEITGHTGELPQLMV